MVGCRRSCVVHRDQFKPSSRLQYKSVRLGTTAAKPEMHSLTLRLFIERCGVLVTGCQRNRHDFELEQPPLRKRMQWAIAGLVDAACQHRGTPTRRPYMERLNNPIQSGLYFPAGHSGLISIFWMPKRSIANMPEHEAQEFHPKGGVLWVLWRINVKAFAERQNIFLQS